MNLNLRIFGSKNCYDCKHFLSFVKKNKLPYQYIDAFSDENQQLCDIYCVYELPHIQIINIENDVVYEVVGEFDEDDCSIILDFMKSDKE